MKVSDAAAAPPVGETPPLQFTEGVSEYVIKYRFDSLGYRSEVERLTPTQIGFQIFDWDVSSVDFDDVRSIAESVKSIHCRKYR